MGRRPGGQLTAARAATHRRQGLLRQKDGELKQANAELEERGKLLYKTKVGTADPCAASDESCTHPLACFDAASIGG